MPTATKKQRRSSKGGNGQKKDEAVELADLIDNHVEETAESVAQTGEYQHVTKHRCPRCKTLMRANGTMSGGRVKRWLCPSAICRKADTTVGVEI